MRRPAAGAAVVAERPVELVVVVTFVVVTLSMVTTIVPLGLKAA